MKENKNNRNGQEKQNSFGPQVEEEIFRMVYFLSRIKKLPVPKHQAK